MAATSPSETPAQIERFWQKVQPTGFCWEWIATRNDQGYGRTRVGEKWKLAHRAAYELLIGPIPEGMHLDHLCRNPSCVNPDHLEPVSARENMLRGFSPLALNLRTSVCQRGHSMEDAYVTRRVDGTPLRRCRQCVRASQLVKTPAAYDRSCKQCGAAFTARQSNKVYCSAACVQRAYVERRARNA
ncbi:MAG: hypothetical protein K0Q46_6466 [Rhodococcus erythropolis]|jgi:hypothetical protein|nr:HNH endonuclease signature motif containing protein [Rhodococcus erythropolis]MDF2899680.1 hypothetical protein [Rhodococcus erythropolis]